MGCSRNAERSNWFLVCFRPEEPKINTGIQRNTLQRKIFVASSSNNETRDSRSEKKINDGGRPGPSRFHRVFKTIFSNPTSSLSKNKRNKRSDKDTRSFKKIFNTSSSQYSSSFSSTFSISSVFRKSKSVSSRRKLQKGMIDMKELKPKKAITIHATQKEEEDGKHNAEMMGLYYLILICLVGLIFWGKAFAIFCAVTCLSLFPCIFK